MRDWAMHERRRYTDKAPGSSLLAIPVYASFRWSLPSPEARKVPMDRLVRRARFWLLILPWCLLLPVWGRYLGRVTDDRGAGRTLALAHALATPAFTYHQGFFGHGIVAVCVAIALIAAVPLGAFSSGTGWRWWRPAVAGVAMGLAGLTEYQALPLLLLFCFYILVARGVASAAVFALASTPFVIALGAYNYACFGGVFELSYHHLGPTDLAALHGSGVGGVTLVPTSEALRGILWSPSRGLLYFAPWLLLAFPGVGAGLMSRDRSSVLLLAAVVAFSIWFGGASQTWEAGWGLGPRILVPFLPVWIALVGLAWGRWRKAVPIAMGPLLAVAWIHIVPATWVFHGYPPAFERPLDHVVPRLIERGWISPNLASDLGMTGTPSLLPGLVFLSLAIATVAAFLYRSVAWRWRAVAMLGAAALLFGLHPTTPPPRREVIESFDRHVRHVHGKQPVWLGPLR